MELTINTIEKAFIAEGLDITLMPIVDHLQNESDKNAIIKNYMLDVVIRALNNEGQSEKWVADYSDDSTFKYENVYYHSPSSGWSLDAVGRWCSFTYCGSRRAFRTRAIGRYLWENFSDLIKETM
ncbi:CGNR zinc finger domain-containing protein [Flavobacterium maritimum]|uniref:CGNR zinc finger domain-containing protein n=1 Tax=Flavobacterium maritimum TaxID=3149042 RepID=UPI0032B4B163